MAAYIIFTPCQSFNRRSPFNRLWKKPKTFLIAVPDSNALAVVPALLGLHVRGLLLRLPLLFLLYLLLDPNDTFFKRKRGGGDSNPRPESRIPLDHDAPPESYAKPCTHEQKGNTAETDPNGDERQTLSGPKLIVLVWKTTKTAKTKEQWLLESTRLVSGSGN